MDPRHKRTQIPKTPETAVLLHSRDNDPWDPWNLRDPVMPGVTWLLGNKPRDSWDLGDIRNHWDNWDPDIPVISGNESWGRQGPKGIPPHTKETRGKNLQIIYQICRC